MTTPVAQAAKTVAEGRLRPARAPGKAPGAAPPAARKPPGAAPPASKKTPASAPRKAPAPAAKKTPGRVGRSFAPSLLAKAGTSTRVVAAEYAACVILIGVAPLISRPGDGGTHLYKANDFVRLSAVSLLFFILALLSATPRGAKAAAAFATLVTLGVVFNARTSIAALGAVFTNAAGGQGAVATAAAGTTTVDAPVYTPVDLSGNPLAQAGDRSGAAPSTGTSSASGLT